jgi:hypothetical protein
VNDDGIEVMVQGEDAGYMVRGHGEGAGYGWMVMVQGDGEGAGGGYK